MRAGGLVIPRETAELLLNDYVDVETRTAALASVTDEADRAKVLNAFAQDIAHRLNVATHVGTTFSDRAIALHGVDTQLAAAQSTGLAAGLFEKLAGRQPESAEPFIRGWIDALAAITSRTGSPESSPPPGTRTLPNPE